MRGVLGALARSVEAAELGRGQARPLSLVPANELCWLSPGAQPQMARAGGDPAHSEATAHLRTRKVAACCRPCCRPLLRSALWAGLLLPATQQRLFRVLLPTDQWSECVMTRTGVPLSRATNHGCLHYDTGRRRLWRCRAGVALAARVHEHQRAGCWLISGGLWRADVRW